MSQAIRTHAVHPDAVRIVALAAAISLNAALLLMALRPLAPTLTHLAISPPPLTVVLQQPPPKAQPIPAPPTLPHLPRHVDKRQPTPIPVPTTDIVTPVSLPQTVTIPPVQTSTSTTITPTTPTATNTAPVRLATLHAPPPAYPAVARRAGMEGTVVLRVLVDAQGIPREVRVDQTSGHHELDRAARNQVLRHWRFRPAEWQGKPVQAWALVPVTFSLQRL